MGLTQVDLFALLLVVASLVTQVLWTCAFFLVDRRIQKGAARTVWRVTWAVGSITCGLMVPSSHPGLRLVAVMYSYMFWVGPALWLTGGKPPSSFAGFVVSVLAVTRLRRPWEPPLARFQPDLTPLAQINRDAVWAHVRALACFAAAMVATHLHIPLFPTGLMLLCIHALALGSDRMVVGTWIRRGYQVEPMFRAPLHSTSVREFWSRRWNRPMARLMHQAVFLRCGGMRHPVWSTLAAFSVSGLWHEYFVDVSLGALDGRMMGFFLIQAVLVLLDSAFRTQRRIPPRAGQALVLGELLVTGALFVHPVMEVLASDPVLRLFISW